MIQTRFPPEVTESFDKFLEETGIPRMDVYKKVGASKGNYMVSDLKDTYVFHEVPLPPPSGVCVQNYARYVKYCEMPPKFLTTPIGSFTKKEHPTLMRFRGQLRGNAAKMQGPAFT